MPTAQAATRMPNNSDRGYEHLRSKSLPMYGGGRWGTIVKPQAESHEYNQMSNTITPAHKYIPAPVGCSECEKFWKALILEIEEKHTSKAPEGKASLRLVKGIARSELRVKPSKHVTSERGFFSGLGCINSNVHGDSFTSMVGSIFNLCQPRPSGTGKTNSDSTLANRGRCREFPKAKLNVTTMRTSPTVPAYGDPSNVRPFVFQSSACVVPKQVGLDRTEAYNGVRSTPPQRDDGDRFYPEPPTSCLSSCVRNRSRHLSMPTMISTSSQLHAKGDRQDMYQGLKQAGKNFKPILRRFHCNRQMDEARSNPSTPPQYATIYNEDFETSRLKPFPPSSSSSHAQGHNRAQPRKILSPSTTPGMFHPSPKEKSISQTPRASGLQQMGAEGYSYHCSPQTSLETSSSRWRRDPRILDEVHSKLPNSSATHTLSQSGHTYAVDVAASKHGPSHQDVSVNSTPSSNHSTQEASHDDIPGFSSATTLSPVSTTESGYTSLSFSTSNYSSSSASSTPRGDNQGSRTSTPGSKTDRPNYISFQAWEPASSADSDRDVELILPTSSWNVKVPHRRINVNRSATSTPAMLTPLVLFTGHGCRSETDDDWEDEEDSDDDAITKS
ncbi:uncharacterized protein [Physcomitrium patens]|uniref:Uncharacterized protein n=1 Tax=Physcomitrium patens TaxID=3218 RepID=A0A2K1IGE7_PHYPA|nr:uncharacterized protein LOC112276565 [Physcomitrium patens]PNR28351.1 hypothetical protein PHYPA_028943 [Physcomitrium patens]|eukprot:XP_024363743.1 uncharacterized protein LOC112276565 [Physcomitrella patens]